MIESIVAAIVLIAIGLPLPVQPDPAALAKFDRLQRHIERDIVIVDTAGLVMEGRIVAATSTAVDVAFGPRVRSFPAERVARVDRLRDSPIDGLVKGAVVGTLLGALTGNARWTLRSAMIYGGLGLALDHGHDAREPIYRAPGPKRVKVSATIRW